MNKKGVSTIIASILIIFLVVVASLFVLQMFNNSSEGLQDENEYEYKISVITSSGYTFYDPEADVLSLQLVSNTEEVADGVQIIITYSDGSQDIGYNTVPEYNSVEKHTIDMSGYRENPPKKVKVAPFIFQGDKKIIGISSPEIDIPTRIQPTTYYNSIIKYNSPKIDYVSYETNSNPQIENLIKTVNNDPSKEDVPIVISGNGGVDSFCYDSDLGMNFNLTGNVTTEELNQQDFCFNKNYLVEFYCDSDQAYSVVHECFYGCSDGACIDFGEKWCNGADLNRDGSVNLADYTLWRNNFGYYTQNVYTLWKQNFGKNNCTGEVVNNSNMCRNQKINIFENFDNHSDLSKWIFYSSSPLSCLLIEEEGIMRFTNGEEYQSCSMALDTSINLSNKDPWSISFDYRLQSSEGCANAIEVVVNNYDYNNNYIDAYSAEVDTYLDPIHGDIPGSHVSILKGSAFYHGPESVHLDPRNKLVHCNYYAENKTKNFKFSYDGSGQLNQYIDDEVVSTYNVSLHSDYSRIQILGYTDNYAFRSYVDNVIVNATKYCVN